MITAQIAAEKTGRAKAAIYAALEQLVAAGVLTATSESKRNRSWEASGLLPIIERLDAREPPNGPAE